MIAFGGNCGVNRLDVEPLTVKAEHAGYVY